MYTDFCWECVRRNTNYINEWYKFVDMKADRFTNPSIDMQLREWGLIDYVNPMEKRPENVFWRQSVSSRSISVKVHSEGLASARILIENFNRFKIKFKKINEKYICIKFYDDFSYFQVFMDENDLSKIDASKYIYVSWNEKSYLSLMAFFSGRLLSTKLEIKNSRLFEVFDLYNNGYTQREVSNILYSEFVTNNEWDSDSWLRARIRYKLKKSEKLINGGFLKYL